MTVCVAVLMAETVSVYPLVTKACAPLREITTLSVWIPIRMVVITVNVVVSMKRLSDHGRWSRKPPRRWDGNSHRPSSNSKVATSCFVAVSMADTESTLLLAT